MSRVRPVVVYGAWRFDLHAVLPPLGIERMLRYDSHNDGVESAAFDRPGPRVDEDERACNKSTQDIKSVTARRLR